MRRLRVLVVAPALSFMVAVGAIAAEVEGSAADGPLAKVTYGTNTIDWQPLEYFESLTLIVTGPDAYVFRKAFNSGEPPVIELFGETGKRLADGSYRWQLTAAPQHAPGLFEAERDRGTHDTKIAQSKQAGSFRIKDGEVASKPRNDQPLTIDDGAPAHALHVDELGRIGINTPTPTADLHIVSGNTPTLRLDQDTTDALTPHLWDVAGNESQFFVRDVTAGSTLPFRIETTAPDDSIFIAADGKVGLGTDMPLTQLDITGPGPGLSWNNTTEAGGGWAFGMNKNIGRFVLRDLSNSNNVIKFHPGANEDLLRIGADTIGDNSPNIVSIGDIAADPFDAILQVQGTIGIGTNSPDDDLDITADGPGIRFNNTGPAGGGWRLVMNPNTGRIGFSDDLTGARNPFKIGSGGINNLFRVGIDTSGVNDDDTVAIGNDSQDAVLQVNGSIIVDGITVHADYVFEPDYELDTIDEHLAFAMENKHLPGLPKAPKGLKGPVDLVSHQMGILEELETAHLYIGQLHRELEQLKQTVRELAAEVDQKTDN